MRCLIQIEPRRRPGDKLQIITVANFKGGSAKTTTALYLSQYLALAGFRVLAIDLDPQASLSAMFGYQPEFDIGENETLYGALRYDEHRRSLSAVIRETYFPGLDLVPANIELMDYEHDTPKALVDAYNDAARHYEDVRTSVLARPVARTFGFGPRALFVVAAG